MRGFAGAKCCAFVVAMAAGLTLPVSATSLSYEAFNYTVLREPERLTRLDRAGRRDGQRCGQNPRDEPRLSGDGDLGKLPRTGGQYSFESFAIGADDNDPNTYVGGDGDTFWFSFLIKREIAGNGGVSNPDYGGVLLGTSVNPANNLFIGKPCRRNQQVCL